MSDSIPVRCFSCNKVIANKYRVYRRMVDEEGVSPLEAKRRLGFKRYCCGRMLDTHVDMSDELLRVCGLPGNPLGDSHPGWLPPPPEGE